MMISVVIDSTEDIQKLEDTIRSCMQCHGASCTFLESVPYRNIRMDMLRRLNTGIECIGVQHVYPQATIVLRLQDAHVAELHVSDGDTPLPVGTSSELKKRKTIEERNWDAYESEARKRPRTLP